MKGKIDEKMYTFQKSIYKTRQRRFPEYRQKLPWKLISFEAESFETEFFGYDFGVKMHYKSKIDCFLIFALCF